MTACAQQSPATESTVGTFSGQRLSLATTTSTYDSGLLDYLIPFFESETRAEVDIIAVGTGQALLLGENGDVDVVLVHARAREDAFVEAGFGTRRYDVMYNDFVIVGPEDDPANAASIESIGEVMAALATTESTFVSRGDDSGTHTKELALWQITDITPSGDWYLEAGQGMGAVLGITNEQQGYTLSDRATFIARQQEGLDLSIIYEGDDALLNPYGVIPVNPDQHTGINSELATAFVEWLTGEDAQRLISEFQVDGQQLFFPNAE